MGRTMALYAGGSTPVTGWNCPAIPNDSGSGMDLSLYSVSADTSGSKQIYPPAGLFDLHTFFVAKTSNATFSLPVNAYNYPTMATSTGALPQNGQPGNGGVPPLGFAASPIPTVNGEVCPDSSVVIPQGFHWAKLWLFRASLPKRTYPHSNALQSLGPIACNPGPWTQAPVPAAPNDSYFTDCSGQSSIDSLSAAGLAARFSEGTAMCMNIEPGRTTMMSKTLACSSQ